jgi:hypothetical protein
MKTKCHQCGSEEAEAYTDPYDSNKRLEICFGCGYVRKITHYILDVNNEMGKIYDIVSEDRESTPEQRVKEIRKVME